jgi:hypothetical protein
MKMTPKLINDLKSHHVNPHHPNSTRTFVNIVEFLRSKNSTCLLRKIVHIILAEI